MKLSQRGLDLIAEVEGLMLKPYKDVAGLWTIGVGHLLTKDELSTGTVNGYAWRNGISHSQALDILSVDAEIAERAVNRYVEVPLSQHQFDALVSFVFNVGSGAFKKSTLLRKLNAGDYQSVPSEMKRWNKAGGKVVKGLINRRNKEIKLWLSNDVKPLHKSRTMQGVGVAGVAQVATILAEASSIKEQAEGITDGLGEYAQVALAVIAIGAIAWVAWARYDDSKRGLR